jgi:hypothetical protein
MENTTLDGGKSYAEFGRCLKGWDVFERAAASNERHWFQDLLSLWCPSGYASDTHGLRLAIRNGYLNFYRLGQSVARVQCTSGELAAEVHYKYVLDEPLPGLSKSPYVRLTGKGVFFRDIPVATYQDISTLRHWIEKAEKKHAGAEKSIVDKLVAKNDHIIDLEMALPAWTLPKVAVRMDLVAIENETVVFWEVKTVDDSRLRCRAEFEEDKFPEVLKQLSHYRDYLRRDSHSEQVESAYRSTAKILVKLRALADKIGPVSPLGASIIAASQVDTLAVAPRANLVVVDVESDHPERTAWTSWKRSHEGKLKDTPMLVLELPALLKLKDAL